MTHCQSSVLAVRFHPSGRVLGICSADHTFKLYSCFVDDCEAPFQGPYAEERSTGKELFSQSLGTWTNACAFSKAGDRVAVASQGNLLHQVELPSLRVQELPWRSLPLMALLYTPAGLFLGGFDRKVGLLRDSGPAWLERNLMSEVAVKVSRGQVRRIASMYEKKVLNTMPELSKCVQEELTASQHANCVLGLVPHPSKKLVASYDSCGVVHFWPFD